MSQKTRLEKQEEVVRMKSVSPSFWERKKKKVKALQGRWESPRREGSFAVASMLLKDARIWERKAV